VEEVEVVEEVEEAADMAEEVDYLTGLTTARICQVHCFQQNLDVSSPNL
jgi:hypothetical protein